MGLSIRDRRGQGTVEYVLGMAISVLLVLGLVYHLNDSFRAYARNYFGDYLACLLETGELPALGGDGGANVGSCQALYQEFSLANGRPQVGGGIGGQNGSGGGMGDGGGGSGNGNGNSNNNRDNNGRGNANNNSQGDTNGNTSADGEDGSGQSAAGRSGSNRGGRRGARGGSGDGEEGSSGSESSVEAERRAAAARRQARPAYTGSTEDSLAGTGATSGDGGRRSRQARREEGLRGRYVVSRDDREIEQIERAPMKIGESSEEKKRGDRMLIVKTLKKENLGSRVDEQMSFGDYFRYLLIAAIIITLVLVIAGQVASMSDDP